MTRPGYPPRLRAVIKAAEQAGWRWTRTKKRQHVRVLPPPGARDHEGNLQSPVVFSSTPSDHRGDRNGIAALRRAGVEI